MSQARQLNIIQGTPEWHDWRRKGIGASDVPAIFGESPYKTKRDLFFEKAGLGDPDDEDRSFIFRRGHETESELRELFENHTKIEINPTCFEKDEIYLASLDGYNKDLGIVEFKLVGQDALKKASAGEIPRHHWIQIQSQLFASDSDKAFWGAKAPRAKGGVVVEIGRDDKFIERIQTEVSKFWDQLLQNKPPSLTDRDTLFITSQSSLDLFAKLKTLKAQKDSISEAYAEIEAKIKSLAKHKRVRGHDVTITEVITSGRIDYKKIPEIQALSDEYLDQFRSKDSVSKRITFGKGE